MQIWDLVTGEQTKNLKGHTDRVLTLQFDDYKIGITPLSLCVCVRVCVCACVRVSFRQRTTPSLSARAPEGKKRLLTFVARLQCQVRSIKQSKFGTSKRAFASTHSVRFAHSRSGPNVFWFTLLFPFLFPFLG